MNSACEQLYAVRQGGRLCGCFYATGQATAIAAAQIRWPGVEAVSLTAELAVVRDQDGPRHTPRTAERGR